MRISESCKFYSGWRVWRRDGADLTCETKEARSAGHKSKCRRSGLPWAPVHLLGALSQGVQHPFLIWKLAGLQFRVNQVAVDADLKAAARRWDELEVLDLLLVRGQELARQTEGLGLVVSHRAVFDFHVHDLVLQEQG